MKKNIVNYYALIVMFLFLIYNKTLYFLEINGIIYQILMIILIVLNAIILIRFKKDIKFKKLVMIVYFFAWMLLSKNVLQSVFGFSNMIVLAMICFTESNYINIIAIFVPIFFIIFLVQLIFFNVLIFTIDMSGKNYVSYDEYYFCEKNYELFSYSSGLMDKTRFTIGKSYEFLNIDGIINISYNDKRIVPQEEYEIYLNTYNCELVGDMNESE